MGGCDIVERKCETLGGKGANYYRHKGKGQILLGIEGLGIRGSRGKERKEGEVGEGEHKEKKNNEKIKESIWSIKGI